METSTEEFTKLVALFRQAWESATKRVSTSELKNEVRSMCNADMVWNEVLLNLIWQILNFYGRIPEFNHLSQAHTTRLVTIMAVFREQHHGYYRLAIDMRSYLATHHLPKASTA